MLRSGLRVFQLEIENQKLIPIKPYTKMARATSEGSRISSGKKRSGTRRRRTRLADATACSLGGDTETVVISSVPCPDGAPQSRAGGVWLCATPFQCR